MTEIVYESMYWIAAYILSTPFTNHHVRSRTMLLGGESANARATPPSQKCYGQLAVVTEWIIQPRRGFEPTVVTRIQVENVEVRIVGTIYSR